MHAGPSSRGVLDQACAGPVSHRMVIAVCAHSQDNTKAIVGCGIGTLFWQTAAGQDNVKIMLIFDEMAMTTEYVEYICRGMRREINNDQTKSRLQVLS